MSARIKRRHYDHVFSLGEACFCATSLAGNGLRVTSDPFDWCVGSSFADRIDMVISGFPNFINQEDLRHIGERAYPEPCHIYLNTRNQIVFNHDFPLSETLEESYAAVRQKYQRRIDRLLRIIKSSKRILFVYMELPETEGGAPSNEAVIALAKKLNDAFVPTKIDILYVRHAPALPDGRVVYNEAADHVVFAQTYVARRNSKDEQAVNKKNLSKVLSFVYRKGKYLSLLKKKIIHFPNRGGDYVVILGIKIKLKRLTKR